MSTASPSPASTRVGDGVDAPWAPSTVDERVTTILVLGYSDRLTTDAADIRTLLDLMVLRGSSGRPVGLLPHRRELLDTANRPLVEFGDDCYVISQAIGSQFLAQLAEQPDRRDVLLALYATDGPSIRLVDAEQLGLLGEVVASDAVATAYRTGLLASGGAAARTTGSS
jgi:ion channel POLLUX/CASTOR